MQTSNISIRKDIKIINVVTTSELSQKIAIDAFNEYEHLSSNLELYRCGYVKDTTMVGRVTIFGNGKMISVGTKSPKQSTKELKKTVKILEDYNLIKKTKIKTNVRNIVGLFDLGIKIDIVKLARTIPKSLYEPDQFPGLIVRIQNSLVALIFSSGKGSLVGGKTFSELNQGLFEVERWVKN